MGSKRAERYSRRRVVGCRCGRNGDGGGGLIESAQSGETRKLYNPPKALMAVQVPLLARGKKSCGAGGLPATGRWDVCCSLWSILSSGLLSISGWNLVMMSEPRSQVRRAADWTGGSGDNPVGVAEKAGLLFWWKFGLMCSADLGKSWRRENDDDKLRQVMGG